MKNEKNKIEKQEYVYQERETMEQFCKRVGIKYTNDTAKLAGTASIRIMRGVKSKNK